jgi:DNA-binding transcriptional MocR family regulator
MLDRCGLARKIHITYYWTALDTDSVIRQLGNWTETRGSLHARLGAALQRAIAQGLLPPGVRLPAERSLAQALALSRTTVLSAYGTLKADGWLESRPGSGTYVCTRSAVTARHLTQHLVLAGSSTLNLLQVDDSEVLDFAVGTTKPLADLPRELYALGPATMDSLLAERNYMPLGLPALRQAIARHYSERGLPTTPDQILVTSGAQQAIAIVTALYVQRGDTVLVESPTYFGGLDVFRFTGARLAPLYVGPEHVAPGEVRDKLIASGSRMIYLTPTYHNPTGVVMPDYARQALAKVADEFGVPLIEDHCMSELSISGETPPWIARYADAHSTIITVGSLSKLFWAALRVGWVRASVAAVAKLARVKTAADLGCSLLTQAIGAQLMPAVNQAKALRRAQLGERRDLLAGLLRERLPSWEFQVPKGGLFLWVRLPGHDARQFAQFAARYGVAITPGPLFSADDSCIEYLRIPFLLDDELIRLGVERLAAAWQDFLSSPSLRAQRISPIV